MEPGEALTTAAQIAVALAGFAGVVVAFRSKALHEWSQRDKFRLLLLLGNALVPLFDCFFGMFLMTIKPVQRVLASFGFSFWFFDLATPIKTRSDGNQEYGGLSLPFLYAWRSGHSSRSLAGLQCFGLGRVFILLCRRHFSTGLRHFAICSDDSSAAVHERDLDSPNA